MAIINDGGLLPISDLPDDTLILKKYIAKQRDLLDVYLLQYMILREDNAELERRLRHLETFRSSN